VVGITAPTRHSARGADIFMFTPSPTEERKIIVSKVWFVTGSSRGLGRNFVEVALSRGDRVAATARNTATLDDLVAAHSDAVLPLELDVTDKVAVFAAVQRAAEHFGRLDVIVNNAGYAQIGAIEELTEKELRDQLETNLFGAVWVVQAALPHLRAQGAGHIIQLSSAAGLMAMPPGGAYHISKWAVEALNESLAQEVAGFGIKVTIIEPGGFATRDGRNPDPLANGHMAQPDPSYDGLRQRLASITGKQPAGDPAAAAQALLEIVDSDHPPLRVLFGQGFYPMLQQVYADRLETWAEWQDLSAAAHGPLAREAAAAQD
jgi:NAD(P)-dependent dehydrogenase (short-subunit alcohol dehydrogenase family)